MQGTSGSGKFDPVPILWRSLSIKVVHLYISLILGIYPKSWKFCDVNFRWLIFVGWFLGALVSPKPLGLPCCTWPSPWPCSPPHPSDGWPRGGASSPPPVPPRGAPGLAPGDVPASVYAVWDFDWWSHGQSRCFSLLGGSWDPRFPSFLFGANAQDVTQQCWQLYMLKLRQIWLRELPRKLELPH